MKTLATIAEAAGLTAVGVLTAAAIVITVLVPTGRGTLP
ncbi:hypothetical protein RAJCM14343_5836 [Rhodococcus aetherivorans]|uniref:Uncharacterized protein n=1 Tax=Rhodococcus aetherivorans TaxID=191292 RepID=A0ABQ0YVX4_9NOCA|nr:hypothetical protein RR21198_3149 [Rhodococcus rhodochrous ATCC 21198]GES40546.1 hypothetical protein RAJCM14343_5836 [Rhodococcus aetherivorans]